jgi:hypothetical protein
MKNIAQRFFEKARKIRIFNIVIPPVFFYLFFWSPITLLTWSISLVSNFIIDSLVLLICLKIFNLDRSLYKKAILKIWLFGFAADVIASQFFILIEGIAALKQIPLDNITRIAVGVLMLLVFFVAGFFIYLFNKEISFKKLDISEKLKMKISMIFAIFTLPYSMLYLCFVYSWNFIPRAGTLFGILCFWIAYLFLAMVALRVVRAQNLKSKIAAIFGILITPCVLLYPVFNHPQSFFGDDYIVPYTENPGSINHQTFFVVFYIVAAIFTLFIATLLVLWCKKLKKVD